MASYDVASNMWPALGRGGQEGWQEEEEEEQEGQQGGAVSGRDWSQSALALLFAVFQGGTKKGRWSILE